MQPIKNADSPVFKMNLPNTCSRCHTNAAMNAEYQIKYPQAAAQYLDSIHGRALLKLGLIVAPSCNDCHGVHDIKRSVDRSSPIHPLNIAKTCGKCHVNVEKTYNESVHGQLLARGDTRAPVCTDCHSAHSIENPGGNHFKATSDERCGKCHQDRLEHYRETYHGKAMALGRPNDAPEVAACYDCHGHHDVLPASNPKSKLSKQNMVATCAKCHPSADASFVRYVPHANPLDKKNYPQFYWVFVFMTTLLIGTFSFFGAHTLFWLFRSGWLYLHDSKTYREAKISTQKGDEWFTRFTPFQRFQHILVVTSFLLLVITGMPLKFYYTGWARALFNLLGGPQTARSLHHFGALVTFLYFGLHLAGVLSNAWSRRAELRDSATGNLSFARIRAVWLGPDSMIPTLHDWKDFVAHQKWFFGKGPKPQFDRWTYWEKFDYFAVFWGVFIIGFSGLIMWFPHLFSRFMPGWAINIALIVHSDEALLAAGFIFTVHFFNTHFRLEKFPMDTVIFSGRVSKSELLHERKRWYDRVAAAGRLDQFRVRDEWDRWKGIARSFGYLFFGLGVILLVLIVYAMISRLRH
jgi:cytochrome b subunit of formate dehydrogenase